MKILINDHPYTNEVYCRLFNNYAYEENELIFCNSYQETKEFIISNLEQRKLHIDLIISDDYSINILRASELCFFKNSLTSSYSKQNFRISSIPFVLYTENKSTVSESNCGYSKVVHKNNNDYSPAIQEFENQIKNWKNAFKEDLGVLGLSNANLNTFNKSKHYKDYKNRVIKNSFKYYCDKTKIVSQEFINDPKPLKYDWFNNNPKQIEDRMEKYRNTYNKHPNYDRKNNERTILHKFFRENPSILLRGNHDDFEYEKRFKYSNSNNSEECDFILKTDFPVYANTTLFEVKKEDVKFYVKKKSKRPQFSANFLAHLLQISGYKDFVNDLNNQVEINNKLGYNPQNNYEYILLAGRIEEKEEMHYLMEKHLNQIFPGIKVQTFEELEQKNEKYYNRFKRLN